MFCPSCGAAVQRPGQRFCTSCGIALVDTAVHTSTEAMPTTPAGADPATGGPATVEGATAAPAAPAATTSLPALGSLTPLLPTEATPLLSPAPATPTTTPADPAAATAAIPATAPVLPPPTTPAAVPAAASTMPVNTVDGGADTEPTVPVEALAAALRDTTAVRVVEQTAHASGADLWAGISPMAGVESDPTISTPATAGTEMGATAAWPVLDPTPAAMQMELAADMVGEPPITPFRITPLVAVSALAAVLAVATALIDVATWKVTGTETNAFTYRLNDLASNYLVGAIIAAVVLVAGAAIGATGRRAGSGLAGGAGLAIAGMMAMMAGQVTQVFDQKDVEYLLKANADSTFSYTLTLTQELGFWLGVAVAVLGVMAFVLSLVSGRGADGRPPAPAAISVIGAVATLLVVVGTLLPMNGADFAEQFSNDFTPPATLLLRLLVLLFIAVGGIAGFVNGRRWGFGVAIGTISVGLWQTVTALTESGDIPFGVALGNWGADDFAPHILTTVGVAVMLLSAIGGLLAKPTRTAVAPQ